MKFSSGGQYLWAVDQKNMVVYSTFTLEKLKVIQCISNQISCLAFNPDDSQISLISYDGFFQRYSQILFSKEGDQDLCKTNEYKACVYLPEKKEVKEKSGEIEQQTERMIVIGQDSLNNGALLTIFDGKTDKFVKNPVLYTNEEFDEAQDLTATFRMNDVCIVTTPKHQIKNLVIASTCLRRGPMTLLTKDSSSQTLSIRFYSLIQRKQSTLKHQLMANMFSQQAWMVFYLCIKLRRLTLLHKQLRQLRMNQSYYKSLRSQLKRFRMRFLQKDSLLLLQKSS